MHHTNCKEPLAGATLIRMEHGGFVIYRGFPHQGSYSEPIAAFSTLEGALCWMHSNMRRVTTNEDQTTHG